MSKIKLATLIGTRPEIIRLSEIIKKCDLVFDHILIHTGQNWDYTLNEIFFKDFALRDPDYFLNCAGNHLGETIGHIIQSSYEILEKEKPDALLILGDTNSSLSAIAAKRLKIPIFHMEAGNRCFDENVPEEINRRIVDHIADVNLPYTEHARRNLIAEGISSTYCFVTGSPLPEVFSKHINAIEESTILNTLGLLPQQYILVSLHREENTSHPQHFTKLIQSLNTVAHTYQLPLIFSTHPRTKKILSQAHITLNPLIQSIDPVGYFDYNKLQTHGFCILSDSGSLGEEASLLHFPAVSLRTSTERPEVMDKANMVLGNLTPDELLNSIQIARMLSDQKPPTISYDYLDTNVSSKIINLIQSYTPIINHSVWHKHF